MNKTILVLEDEEPLIRAIEAKLESEGFNVVNARAVDLALDYLKQGGKVDGIWVDHYLFGKQSGLDFVTQLRQGKLGQNLPVFVVSNTVSQDKVQTYVSLIIQKFYTKVDYRLDEIVTDIKKVLNKK